MAFTISDDVPENSAPVSGAPFRYTIGDENATLAPEQKDGAIMSAVRPFMETAQHGAESLGDLVGNAAKFVTGHEMKQDPTPMQETLRDKHAAGTADRLDYQRAFLEGMNNSPGGKLLGAVGGLLPEANVVTTAFSKWINPKIEEMTGADPSTVQLVEMAGLPVAGKILGPKGANLKESDLPSAKAAGMVKDAVSSPIQTTANIADAALSIPKAAATPLTRGILDATNPLTGGRGITESLGTSIAKEGTRLENNIPGLKFTTGAKTGNPRAIGLEDMLANNARWSSEFTERNQSNVKAVIDHFNNTLDSIYSGETVPENFGRRLSSAYNGTIDSLNKTRREQAKIDFDAAYEGSKEAGQYIQSNNTFRALQELRDEGSERLLTKSKEIGGKEARKLLSNIGTPSKAGNEMASPLTIKELGNALSDFGQQAANREHPEAVRRVYSRIYDSLNKDLDAEIANPKGDPRRAAMLSVARDNYRQFSDKMADLQKTTLGNIIGYAAHDSKGNLTISPETLANKFQTLPPSELRGTLKFLDDNHPEVADMGRRYVLEQVLQKAQEGAGLRGVGTTKPFPKAEFVKGLPTPEKLNILFKDNRAHEDITDIAAATNRLIDWGAEKSGSQTFQRGMFEKLIGLGKGTLVKAVISDSIAKDLLDPSRRHQMGVQARQWQKMFDKMKEKGGELYSDETGMADVIPFKAMKDKLGAMQNTSGPRKGVYDMNSLAKPDEMGALRQMMEYKNRPANQLQNLTPEDYNQATSPKPHGRLHTIPDQIEWLKTHTHPDMVNEWTGGGRNPLHKWSPEDIQMMYEASQPTMGDL